MEKIIKISRSLNWYLFALFLSLILIFPITTISYEALSAGPNSMGDKKQVIISEKDYQIINKNYNSSIEKGFCLYGTINSEQIIIEEIDYVNQSLSSGQGYINFLCIRETIKRLPELYTNPHYKMIGNVHTHPVDPYPSYADVYSMGLLAPVQRTFGIYNGEKLNFFGRIGKLDTIKINETK